MPKSERSSNPAWALNVIDPSASPKPVRRLVIGTTMLAPPERRRRVSVVSRVVRVSLLWIWRHSRPASKVTSISPAGRSASPPSRVFWKTEVIVRRRATSNPASAPVGSGPSTASVPSSAACRSAVVSKRRSIRVSVSERLASTVLVRRKLLTGLVSDPAVEKVSVEERRASGVSAPKVRRTPGTAGSAVSVTVLSPSRLRLSFRT